ncbi:MAG: radical SAM protein [Clostridia bacterium]|nr:radical SAM protein [Clostridia bacterium]
MKHLTFLVKPASDLCDLRCKYCFYADVAANRTVKSRGIMSRDTARILLEKAFSATEAGGNVTFMFQGGEPTLAGLDFFRDFVSMEARLCPPGVTIHHAIQTNGMTMTTEWAEFLRDNRFLVGLSLDGCADLHDRNRVDAAGCGSYRRVLEALDCLKNAGAETNLLCVLTDQLAKKPRRVYESLKELGVPIQFIPCLDPLEARRGSMPWSLTPDYYGGFLCALFDLWYADLEGGRYVSIRFFDDLLRRLLGLPPSSCAMAGSCGHYLVVEGDGALYPCDFYVLDEWYLGISGRTRWRKP